MISRNLDLTISKANVLAGLLPILNATQSVNDDEEITSFELVNYDKETGMFHFKGSTEKFAEERTDIIQLNG